MYREWSETQPESSDLGVILIFIEEKHVCFSRSSFYDAKLEQEEERALLCSGFAGVTACKTLEELFLSKLELV